MGALVRLQGMRAAAPHTRSRIYTGISCAFFFAPFPCLELIFWKIQKQSQRERGQGERKSSSEEGRIQDTLRGLKAGGLQERACTHVGWGSRHSMAPSSHFGHPGAANPAPNKALGREQRLGGGHRLQRAPCSWWLLVPGRGQSIMYKTDPEGQGGYKR